AISKLVRGMSVDQVIGLLEGNTCGLRPTSCADQMTRGLREAQAAEGDVVLESPYMFREMAF
ncbi:MAG: TSCPD domain-containing protein, partial [Olsenella sp.]|nr:TSCPD domain-containing protein [Olsenella sp.]